MTSDNLIRSVITLLLILLVRVCASVEEIGIHPFACQELFTGCSALLYHINRGLQAEQIALFYSVNATQIIPIPHGDREDYLVKVPCVCQNFNDTRAYFHDTLYRVKENDTFLNVSDWVYSGQAWEVGGEQGKFGTGSDFTMHLLCACAEAGSPVMVTYTVQQKDTLSDIARRLSSTTSGIQSMNSFLNDLNYIEAGWVLFVPKDIDVPPSKTDKKPVLKWPIVIGILSTMTFLLMATLIIICYRRKGYGNKSKGEIKSVSKSLSMTRGTSLQTLNMEIMEDGTAFDSDKPIVYTLEEIEEATINFDETRKIGAGGYGCVYFGVLGRQEVAIKKMKSNKSKEFLAELKVLCKIHHINVVELLGYASGDDHLYLVYEHIQNGSLSDHLHDPLLQGYQPLSWTARTQIAVDAAKGIEYIHDQTKKRYVHRDIKTSNILLDEGLRAKVADFGLAKLVERTSDEDLIATRLVGTPGYLPPESVKELQVTTKTDVFAFGVVLAELITGQRALVRDNWEPTKLRSLISVVYKIFQDEDPEAALENTIDRNLRGSYPMDDIYKMAEISDWCLSEDPINRPEMREIVPILSKIMTSSQEWEATLGGSSPVFSGLHNGR
ncbi:protein kinase family protein / peptidoglycan-binding LysM domain-containing protein [Euphorbia peplus]|nr:protein kinase family protein / peptidoglycan-binding LysM domain-containing protein [Euphorbia peplus]